jgi:nanoRNase/pAp phosphatase (c-di-AMP/oligoRNAs hydrolase)
LRLQPKTFFEEPEIIEPDKIGRHVEVFMGEDYTFKTYRGYFYMTHFSLTIECEQDELQDALQFINSQEMIDVEETFDFDRKERLVGDMDMYFKVLEDETMEKLFVMHTRKQKMEELC